MRNSKISWTDHSWNAVIGCSKISEGCRNCYAETMSLKFKLTPKEWIAKNAKENVILKSKKLDELKKIKEPSMIFVNSMSDFFHEEIPDSFRDQMMLAMIESPQHIYQILTKRAEKMREYLTEETRQRLQSQRLIPFDWPIPKIWWGVSVEDRKNLDRIKILQQVPADIRFISFEPLLEDLRELNLEGISWIVCGGESGSNFRPMDHAWARSIRNQCLAQNVEFFFKQSAAYRSETGTALEEANGAKTVWQYFPVDGMRYRDNLQSATYIYDGSDQLSVDWQEELSFDDQYLDKLDNSLIENILERGKILKKWQDRLAQHKKGHFQAWIRERRQYSLSGAYRAIAAYEAFSNYPTVGQYFPEAKTVYLLSEKSTPEDARKEAIEQAEKGDPVTHKDAQAIVRKHKPPKPSKPESVSIIISAETDTEKLAKILKEKLGHEALTLIQKLADDLERLN